MKLTDLIKKAHDDLIESSSVEHDEELCDICQAQSDDFPGGNVSGETFTKEEVDAKVDAATATLQAQLDELSAAQSVAKIDEAVAAAKVELEEQIAALQSTLDEAKIAQAAAESAATAAETQFADLTKYLEDTATAAEAEAALEAKKTERVEAVKEAASFDDDYLTANADRWASMDDDIFTATLEDYKGLVAKSGGKTPESKIPSTTAFETASSDENAKSVLSTIGELRDVGIDPRKSY
jgi:Tfp pilus assembly protein PilX